MNKENIISFLEENGLSEIEELKYKEGLLAVRFYYDFDEDELKAAKAYANDECEEEKESDAWYEEYFLPYLNDVAIDNVGEVMEELMEELKLEVQYISYDLDKETHDYSEFIALIGAEGTELDIDDMLENLDI